MNQIAIVGMGCVFPGADSPQQYWDNLLNLKDSTTPLNKSDLGVDVDKYYDPVKGTIDKISYNKNGHVRDFKFQTSGYELPSDKLNSLDNLFKWSLHASSQALQDSGYRDGKKSFNREKCGLILGNIGMPTHSGKKLTSKFYHKVLEPYIQELIDNNDFKFDEYWDKEGLSDANLQTGSYNAILSAQALGLEGPCYTVDAACASALYVINLASHYLNSGKVDMMIAGSVCHADHIYVDHGFNVLQAFPDKGDCVPFDQNSEGLKAGEGAGAIVLKRYSDAIKDGDKIYGVIESIGLSNDAGAKHILVPDFNGQVLSLERAYKNHNRNVDYIECHATGTPVGDQVELNSIEHFFTEHGDIPLIGANKGNIGHMLTASGMASILKVLLSMEHNTIPGTLNVDKLVETKNSKLTIKNIVRENRSWPDHEGEKRAGINAFGFGGVNGHMIIKQTLDQNEHEHYKLAQPKVEMTDMSIVGMSVGMSGTYKLEDFNSTIQDGNQHYQKLPLTRWSGIEDRKDILKSFGINDVPTGAYVEKFYFDCMRFKLPPKMAGNHLLSHMSLMQIAARAFYDAGFKFDGEKRNIAVIVAGDVDYTCYRYQARNEISWQIEETLERCNIHLTEEQQSKLKTIVKDSLFPEPYAEGITGGIGNVVASRISAILKLNGPSFSICSQENSVFKAIELAQLLLSNSNVEAVIVGSGAFSGGLENVLWKNKVHSVNTGKKSLSFDIESNGWDIGEGGGVIVLKRESDAKNNNQKIYSTIKSLDIVQSNRSDNLEFEPVSKAVTQVVRNSLSLAGKQASDISYIELNASGIALEDKAEIKGLSQVYESSVGNKCVVGSVKSNYGHLSAASGIASIIKTSLCLFNKYLPGTPNWGEEKYKDDWNSSNLIVSSKSKDWDLPSNNKRLAAINGIGQDRSYVHLIMEEPDDENRIEIIEEVDEEALRKNSLISEIYIGREKTIPDMILNHKDRELFSNNSHSSDNKSDNTKSESKSDNTLDISAIVSNKKITSINKNNQVDQINGKAEIDNIVLKQFIRNSKTHLEFLKMEQQFYARSKSLLNVMGGTYNSSNTLGSPYDSSVKNTDQNKTETQIVAKSDAVSNVIKIRPSNLVFDENQLLEMTIGKVSNVLGAEYEEADTYPVRTRMPSPPYMFVSRITKMTAQKGKLEPCLVEWEYDLPEDAWYVSHGLVPAFVSLESSHAMIVAFTYIGCDQMFKGELCYRALDSKTTLYGPMPKAGETLRGTVDIKSFIKVGKNVLISYEFNCYVNDVRSFKLEANSGFFPLKNIKKAKNFSTSDIFDGAVKVKSDYISLIRSKKTSFIDSDITAIQNGDLETCFGAGYGKTIIPGLCSPDARMLDRVMDLVPDGGAWGLGSVIGEKDIDPEHWVFKSHFKNDPVLPGTFIVEGCEQLMKFFMYYMGLHLEPNLQPELLDNHQYSAKFRGEVKCEANTLRYRLTCKKLDVIYKKDSNELSDISITFVVEIIYNDSVIGVCDNLGARFVSRN
ncbi:MAG: beta-ketoacyl synthase N-terminal-like domain-containing protein [Pseudomonadota bacterium]